MSAFDRNIAIIIGINQYQNGIHPLKTAVPDALRLADIFQNFYEYTLINPFLNSETAIVDRDVTLDNLRSLLTDILPNQIKPTKSDRLLFYFAGHGIAQNSETGPQGYIVPQNADLNEPKSLLPMQELHDSLAALECLHLLVILDCCFAGTFRWASTRRLIPIPQKIHWEHYHRFINYPAWEVITSASYNQEALDLLNQDNRGVGESGQHSPFAEGLFEALEEEKADLIKDGVITAPELYLYLRDYVEKKTQQMQTPGLWTLKKHDRGEFIFKLSDVEPDLESAPELNPENNPYRGLKAYDEKHARFFFGRQELIQRLFTQVSRSQQQFTVVLGISGSGKSSLVKAGLLPKLRQEQVNLIEACILSLVILAVLPYFPLKYLPISYAYQWQIMETIRPGSNPFQELVHTFSSLANQEITVKNIQDNPQQLVDLINQWSQNHPQHKLLLVIDQFEELITQAPKLISNSEEKKETWWEQVKIILKLGKQKETISESEEFEPQWQQFLDLLVNIIQNCPQLSIVITLRSDFEPRFAESVLNPYWNRFIVRPMRPDELREVVEAPATEMALYFEPANLVDRLVDEVNQMPGALPLLSFTLSELYIKLYEEWKGGIKSDRSLTVDREFEKQGGVAGSLTNRANEEYENLPDDAHRVTMSRVMLRMLEIEGGEAVRRRVLESELIYPSEEENKRVEAVLDCLVKARLIVTGKDVESGESYYEPAHDFLVKGWDKLQIWIQEEQENLALQRLLTPATQAWSKNQLKRDLWNANSRLDRLQEIKQSEESWLNHLETNFIRSSFERRQFIHRVRLRIATAFILIVSGFAIWALIGQRKALIGQAIASQQSAKVNLSLNQSLNGMVYGLQAGTSLQDPLVQNRLLQLFNSTDQIQEEIKDTLQWAIYQVRENNRMKGHSSIVRSTISPNNQLLASAGEDGIINLWNLQGKRLAWWQGDSKRVWKVAFSPDNQLLASAGEDGSVRIWNLQGQLLDELKGHKGHVRYVTFSSDGQTIASTGGQDGMVYLWDLQGKKIKSWQADTMAMTKTANFNPHHQLIVTTGKEKKIKIWNLETKLIQTLDFHAWGAFFSPNGKYIVAAGDDGNIGLWNWQYQLVKKWQAHEQRIWNVAFSLDSQQIASAGEDGTVRVWNLQGQQLAKFQGHTGPVRSVRFTADSQQLVSSGDDRTTRLWNLQNRQLQEFSIAQGSINKIIFTSDNQQLITSSRDGSASIWNFQGQQLTELSNSNSLVNDLSISEDAQVMAQSNQNGLITIFDWQTKKQLQTFSESEKPIENILLSPKGQLLASSERDGTIRVRNVNNGQQLAVLEDHNGIVNHLDFSSNGKLLASAGSDGKVNVWNIQTQKLLHTFQDHIGQVYKINFSLDDRRLVSAGEDKTIRVWNLGTGVSTSIFQVYEQEITAVKFSPDNQKIVSSDSGGTIQLWDLQQQQQTANWKAHQTSIKDIDFSSDGKLLVTLGNKGHIKLWRIESFNELMTIGCESIGNFLQNQTDLITLNVSLCPQITKKMSNSVEVNNSSATKITTNLILDTSPEKKRTTSAKTLPRPSG